jgi:hypothetical protein
LVSWLTTWMRPRSERGEEEREQNCKFEDMV